MGSSVTMEKEGLQCCLDNLLTQGVTITSIATDRHTGVASLMKNEYSLIDHQYDVWHMTKGVTKKAKAKHCGHGFSQFQKTYGGPNKPVRVMHSFVLRNGNLLYSIFPMYMSQ